MNIGDSKSSLCTVYRACIYNVMYQCSSSKTDQHTILHLMYLYDIVRCIEYVYKSLFIIFFVQLFYVGLPSVLTTDQESEFNKKINRELTAVLNINHRLTTAYHPQANGLDERFNQILSRSLAKFAQDNHECWDEKLCAVVYAYNSSVLVSFYHFSNVPCY